MFHQHELFIGLLGVQRVDGQQLREELDHSRDFVPCPGDTLEWLLQCFTGQGCGVTGFPPQRLAELRVHRQGALQQRGAGAWQADDHQWVVDFQLEDLWVTPTVILDDQTVDQLRQQFLTQQSAPRHG
ncbi:hypothetical protein D9M73_184930 [compost metagenome]